jgi:hypothetical protein
MPSFQSDLEFDLKQIKNFKRTLLRVRDVSRRTKLVVDACKSAAQPWKEVLKENIYKTITKRTGKMRRSITVRKYQDRGTDRIGAKVGPSRARRYGGATGGQGWRVHFFAKPAKYMDAKYKIPFKSIYARKTRIVMLRAEINFRRLFEAARDRKTPRFL